MREKKETSDGRASQRFSNLKAPFENRVRKICVWNDKIVKTEGKQGKERQEAKSK